MKKKNMLLPAALAVCVAAAALIFCADNAVKGASRGLTVCLNVIIPSLFPFLVLSAFIVKAELTPNGGGIAAFFMRKLFGLPGEALPAVLLGLTAGYPAGLKTAELLLERGALTKGEAKRLCLFAVNSGAAFCVSAAGRILSGGSRVGLLIFLSTTAANILIGLFTKRFASSDIGDKCAITKENIAPGVCEALVFSVDSAIKSTFSLCGWIVLFSTFGEIISGFVTNRLLSASITCVSEVTAALFFSSGYGGAVLAAFCLGFGGFSVHCQLLPSLSAIGIKYRYFFVTRTAAGLLSSAFTLFFGKLSGIAVMAEASSYPTLALSVSPAAAFALIFMCCVFILNLANAKKKCYNGKRTERSELIS